MTQRLRASLACFTVLALVAGACSDDSGTASNSGEASNGGSAGSGKGGSATSSGGKSKGNSGDGGANNTQASGGVTNAGGASLGGVSGAGSNIGGEGTAGNGDAGRSSAAGHGGQPNAAAGNGGASGGSSAAAGNGGAAGEPSGNAGAAGMVGAGGTAGAGGAANTAGAGGAAPECSPPGTADQEQLNTATFLLASATAPVSQTFKPGSSGILTGITVRGYWCGQAAGSLVLTVYSGGLALGSGSIPVTSLSSCGDLEPVFFDLRSQCISVAMLEPLKFELTTAGVSAAGTCPVNACVGGLWESTFCTHDVDCQSQFDASKTSGNLYTAGAASGVDAMGDDDLYFITAMYP